MYTNIIHNDDICNYFLKNQQFIFNSLGNCRECRINTLDYTIIMPDQVICPNYTYGTYGTYDGKATSCEGEVDTLHNSLWFYFYSIWGPYSFGDTVITLEFE